MVLITLIHKQCDVIQTLAVSSVKSCGVWFLSKRCFEGIDFSYFVYIVVSHTSLPPIHHRFVPSFVNYKKGCTRLAATSDKVFQLLAHGWWFYRGTPASSTTQGFQSGPVPGTFTRLRSCIVPAEITEPPKISGGQNHKYDGR